MWHGRCFEDELKGSILLLSAFAPTFSFFSLNENLRRRDHRSGAGPEVAVASPPKTYESKFFRGDFEQFGKQDSRYKAILRPLFCHSSVLKYTSSLLQWWARNDTWLPNITEIDPPKLTGWIRPCLQLPFIRCLFIAPKKFHPRFFSVINKTNRIDRTVRGCCWSPTLTKRIRYSDWFQVLRNLLLSVYLKVLHSGQTSL